jgi:hypothetical protein
MWAVAAPAPHLGGDSLSPLGTYYCGNILTQGKVSFLGDVLVVGSVGLVAFLIHRTRPPWSVSWGLQRSWRLPRGFTNGNSRNGGAGEDGIPGHEWRALRVTGVVGSGRSI